MRWEWKRRTSATTVKMYFHKTVLTSFLKLSNPAVLVGVGLVGSVATYLLLLQTVLPLLSHLRFTFGVWRKTRPGARMWQSKLWTLRGKGFTLEAVTMQEFHSLESRTKDSNLRNFTHMKQSVNLKSADVLPVYANRFSSELLFFSVLFLLNVYLLYMFLFVLTVCKVLVAYLLLILKL